MIISLHFRERLSGVLQVVQDELDNLVAVIRTWSNVEHNDDGSHSPNVGNILEFMAGANIGAGQPVYISAGAEQTAAGQAFLADATSTAKSTQAAVVGLATQATSAGAFVRTRDRGVFKGLVGLTAGKAYYVGTTPGSLTLTTPTNAVLIGLAISTTELLLLLRNPIIIAQQALVTWTGTTSGSQNMATGSVLAFTATGTYSITVSTAMTLVVRGVSGGGGGGISDNNGGGNGAGGGGGGAYSTGGGNSVSFVAGKTYTAVVGAGGAANVAGGGTTFINTTDTVTIIDEGGGQPGSANITAGNGGSPNVGSITAGGAGGAGGANGNGTTGSNATNGAAGGGGGGGAAPGNGAQGGAGSAAAGTGGLPGANGTNNGGAAGGGGTGATGGGGGGGGGAQIAGVTGSFGGGGGGGAWGTGTGGAGQGGVVVLTFVSAP